MPDQKNLILAIALSVVILVAFQYFFAQPQSSRDDNLSEIGLEDDGSFAGDTFEGIAGAEDLVDPSLLRPEGDAQADGPQAVPEIEVALGAQLPRMQAINATPRIEINTAHQLDGEERGLLGSISLIGGRLDDLTLLGYRETVEPDSPQILLLNPRNTENAYYSDFGWVAADSTTMVPDVSTRWTTHDEVLHEGAPVVLRWESEDGVVFEREIAVDRDYMFTVTERVINQSDRSVRLSPYARVLRLGTPDTLGFFILHEGPYGVFDGSLEEFSYDGLQEDVSVSRDTTGGWIGFTDKYWMVTLVPDQETEITAQFVSPEEGPTRYIASYLGEQVSVPPGQSTETVHRVFAGAKEVDVIDGYQNALGIDNFTRAIDWGWLYFLTRPFFYVIHFIHGIVGNFGVAILVFTVLIKALMFPLADKSYRAMARMKALQPQMMDIRDRFKEDRQKMNLEMMALYKREKVNPAAGCLPILVQIPIFFALYKVLFVTIEMRHAPFFGWINDLSAPDPTSIFTLFGLLPIPLPGFLQVGIWPVIMGLTMFLQMRMNPTPPDKLQAQIFMAMPVVFTFVLAGFPAGLVIYWTWNNLLSIAQQYIIMRRLGVSPGGGPAPGAAMPLGGPGQGNQGPGNQGQPNAGQAASAAGAAQAAAGGAKANGQAANANAGGGNKSRKRNGAAPPNGDDAGRQGNGQPAAARQARQTAADDGTPADDGPGPNRPKSTISRARPKRSGSSSSKRRRR